MKLYSEELTMIDNCKWETDLAGVKLKTLKKWRICTEISLLETKFYTTHPLYSIWNEPTQDSIGVFINVKVRILILKLFSVAIGEIIMKMRKKF